MNKLNAKARITEVDGFSDTLIRIFNADLQVQKDEFLKNQIAELSALSDAITNAILQDKAVSNLDAADSKRDEAVKNLGALLTGYAVFPVEEKRTAAVALKAVYEKYSKSGILTASYVSESSMIESMLGDFSSADAAANIEKLDGIELMIKAIRSAQDDFTAANDAYVKAEGSKDASASSYKKSILVLINDKIIPYLNTMQIVGNTNVLAFAKNVEIEVARINETISKRAK